MTTLLIVTFAYFLIGIIAFSLTVYTHNNIITKTIVRVFETPQNFNRFLFFYWIIPIAVSVLASMLLQL